MHDNLRHSRCIYNHKAVAFPLKCPQKHRHKDMKLGDTNWLQDELDLRLSCNQRNALNVCVDVSNRGNDTDLLVEGVDGFLVDVIAGYNGQVSEPWHVESDKASW